MPFNQPDQIRYYTFASLSNYPLSHAVFTRQGGVSPAPWASLNMGATVGDELPRVYENRVRAFSTFGCPRESIFDVWQVHSAKVVCTNQPKPPNTPHLKADAIITDTPGVALFMRFADCVPILLFDPTRRVIGLVHAGWLGTINKVANAAVDAMRNQYLCHPADIIAGIGPSIARHHYHIGNDVAEKVKKAFGQDASGILTHQNGEVQFDLWEANGLILRNAGVSHIEVAGICSACHLEDWYSHRGENGKTGRFGVLLTLMT